MGYGDSEPKEVFRPDGSSYSPKKWEIVIYHGSRMDGRANRRKYRFDGTKAEARSFRDEKRLLLEKGISLDGDKVTFHEFSSDWHKKRADSGEYAEKTMEGESYMLRNLCDALGGLKLKDVNALAIENAYRHIKTSRAGRNGKGLSGKTMNGHHRLMNQIMKAAVNFDLILRNPCDKVKAPKIDTKPKKILEGVEFRRLIACIESSEAEAFLSFEAKEARQTKRGNAFARVCVRDLHGLAFVVSLRLLISTGVRLGELTGLRRRDVAADCSLIMVRQTLTNRGAIKDPKSDAGIRDIPLGHGAAKALCHWLDVQERALRSLGMTDFRDIPVICNDLGGYVSHSNYEKWFRGWCNENGLRDDIHPHLLRHTFLSCMAMNGVDQKTLQTIAGHSSFTTTADYYIHSTKDKQREAAVKMDALITGGRLDLPEGARKTA